MTNCYQFCKDEIFYDVTNRKTRKYLFLGLCCGKSFYRTVQERVISIQFDPQYSG